MASYGIENDPKARAALNAAAKGLFTQKGYEGTSMREVAARAKVNVAVAMREFGGKSGLFKEAVVSGFDLGDALRGTRGLWGASLVDLALGGGFSAYAPSALSTGSETAARVLQEGFETRLVLPLAERLSGVEGGGGAEGRARLILAILAGLAFGRETFGLKRGAEEAERAAEMIQEIVGR